MNISSVNTFNKPTALHGPRKYSELANNIPNKIHDELYNAAIEKLIADLNNYKDVVDIVNTKNEKWEDIIISINEISYTEYWRASDVMITFKYYVDVDGKELPRLRRFRFDLSPYWGNCYTKENHSVSNVKFDKNIPNDAEIIKYDYIRGKATVRSKLEDIEYDVDFDEINNSDNKSDDVKLPYDTFTRLVNINL